MQIKLLVVSALTALSFTGCFIAQVDSKEVGVVIKQGEVQKEILPAGIHVNLLPFNTLEHMRVANKVANFVGSEDKEDTPNELNAPNIMVMTEQNLPIPLDISVMYQLKPESAPDIFAKFGKDGVWDNMLIVKEVRSSVRDEIGQVSLETLNKSRNSYEGKILIAMNKNLNKHGITVTNVQLRNIGIPKIIQDAVLQKESALQQAERAKYEVEKAKAEAFIKIAKADGVAKANNILSASLTDKLVQYKQLEIQRLQVDKWNGVMPTVTAGQNSSFLISPK